MLNDNIKNTVVGSYFAGHGLTKAEEIYKKPIADGWTTTISVWAQPGEDKKSVGIKYVDLINAISQNGFKSYISIKPSALQFNLNLLEYISKEVHDPNVSIQFDSFSQDLAEKSLRYFNHAKTIYDNVGYTIPARWLRNFKEDKEITKMSMPVRVVKGQWSDPAFIKINVHENFLKIIKILIGSAPLIAIATHDLRLVEKAIELFDNVETDFELQQFFSLPLITKAIQSRFNRRNINIRLYAAYGEPYLPYNIQNVTESPAVIEWFVRDLTNLKRRFNLL